MYAIKQPKSFRSPTFLLLLIGAALASLIFYILWMLNIAEEENQIQGGILFLTLLGSITGIGFNVHTSRIENLSSAKDREIQQVKTSTAEEIQALGEEVFQNRLQLIQQAQGALSQLTGEEIFQLLPPQLRNRTEFFISRVRNYEEYYAACRKISDHLMGNEKQLKALSKESCNEVLNQLNEENLHRLNLDNAETKQRFYEDIYIHLRGWMKSSIEYDLPMPIPPRSIPDRLLYVNAFKFLRDERIEWFLLSDAKLETILKKYLNILIEQIESYK